MEKELVLLFEAAKKAADAAAVGGVSSSGPEVSRCLDALKQLKNFPVNYDTLVSTQVGKRLRHLTKHPKERIQTMVSDLLQLWKKIIIDETARNKKNDITDNKSSLKTEVVKSDTVKIADVQTAGAAKFERVSNAEKLIANAGTVKVEKITKEEKQASSMKKPSLAPIAPPKLTSVFKCNDVVRDKFREILMEALSKVASEAKEDLRDEVNACDPMRVAVSVESVMFEKLGRSNGTQKHKYRSIMFNVKDPNNPDLRRRILLGQVRPEILINMTPEEMASDQRQQENNQIKERALFDCERGGPPKATTDQFRCGRCGQRKCTYYQLQTRSADEPMTTFVTCVNCNNHWKFC